MAATVTDLKKSETMLSIQGGRVVRKQISQFMDDGDVDEYVQKASDAVLTCRERGRHMFPSIRMAGVEFVDVDEDGLLIRRLRCLCCKLAERVERWEARGRGANVRYGRVAATTQYVRGEDGESYLGPQGHGRMTPKMVQASLLTSALAGQSIGALRKSARRKHDQEVRAKEPAAKKTAGKKAAAKKPAAERAAS